MATDRIKEITKQLEDKSISILKKGKEIEELQEELNLAEEEVETVIMEKNYKLDQAIDDLRERPNQEFVNICTLGNALTEHDIMLLKLLNCVILQEDNPYFVRSEATNIFLQKDDFIAVLTDRKSRQFSRPIFDKLNDFVQNRTAIEFSNNKLLVVLYNFLVELFRKLNIKSTMYTTFNRIKEIRA
jgi:hypothetical protein